MVGESSPPGRDGVPDVTIMVSCYNEETSIASTLATLVLGLRRCSLNAEVIVMDDCSQDLSPDVVREFMDGVTDPRIEIRLHVNDVNRGLVPNYFEAARLGRGKYYWMVSGDDVLDEETYVTLFSALGRADVIIPSVIRYRGRPLYRRVLSKLYGWIVNRLSGYAIKYYNGGPLLERATVLELADTVRGFGYSAEMIVTLLDQGKSYVEVPVVFNDRVDGKSSAVNMKNLREVLAFFGRLRRRRRVHAVTRRDAGPVEQERDAVDR